MKRIITFALFISLITGLMAAMPSFEAKASTSTFKYYDYSTKKTVKYDYISPTFKFKGETFNLASTPAIIIDNTSLGSAKHVFKNNGLSTYSYNKKEKRITMKHNGNKLVMYVGSHTAYLNGKEITTGVAPMRIKYKSSKKIVTLVPTRFVSENLGYKYDWNQAAETVTITEVIKLFYDGKEKVYDGTLCEASYNGTGINLGASKDVIISDNAMLRAKKIFHDIMDIDYTFDKKSGKITFSKGELTLVMKLDDKHAFLNDHMIIAPVTPKVIANYNAGTELLYVPGRFVAENLGYKYYWNESKKTSEISYTDKVGVADFKDKIVSFSYGNEVEVPEDIDSIDISSVFGTVDIPLPEGFDDNSAPIEDRYYDDMLRITLDGDYSEFYSGVKLNFSNPNILQVAVVCLHTGKTVINIYTKGAMAYKYHFENGCYKLTIDKPSKFYDKIIVLDAGHGDYDPGTVHEGYNEKDINFSLVWDYLRPLFEESDVKAYFSRHDDTLVDLYERGAFAQKVDGDIFVSIHQNSNSNTKASGTSVYYSTINYVETPSGLNSEKMAKLFLKNITETLGTTNRGTIDKGFVVVRDNTVPSVLLEMGFMSNHKELMKLTNLKFREKEAKVIFDTIMQIFETYPTGRTKVYDCVGKEPATVTDTDTDTATDTDTDTDTDANEENLGENPDDTSEMVIMQ